MKYTLLVLLTAISLANPLFHIIDGDTLKHTDNGITTKLRLAYIDAPELNQDFGKDSKQLLKATIENCKDLQILNGPKDIYNRTLITLICENENINMALVRMGYAWSYNRTKNNMYMKMEQQARKYKLGLWEFENPVNPRDYRKAQKINAKTK